ncbi:NPCBM/NEW2 domain-containing protein [Actinoplanes sp. NPDC051411]|uniref:NPCBM/NEW2 domain-containing protein n=1 Tax=Actinoplanes sp. NPDC051411 TaxID=3155522 RepID=UPI00341466F6
MIGGKRDSASKSRSAWLSWPAWTGIGSLAGLVALAVAVVAWWWPQSASSDVSSGAPASPGGAGAPANGSAGQTYLYQLPANSAGQAGQQRSPADVVLAGNHYAHSTGMWTDCMGKINPKVAFYAGGKYQHLAGTLGIADPAPGNTSVIVYVYADDSQFKTFDLSHDQTLPIDIDISGFTRLSFSSLTLGECPHTPKPLVYLGDTVVF